MVNRSVWQGMAGPVGGVTRAVLSIAVALGLASTPPLREAIIAAEPTFAPGLFALALLGAASQWLVFSRANRMRRRRIEHVLGQIAARWGLGPMLLLFLAPIWSHWAGRPPDYLVAYSAVLGHLPWRDAMAHAEGGLRLLAEGSFGAYSERRPLHACWLAVRLALGPGDLDSALLAQAVVLGLAAFLFVRAVGLRHGFWSGLGAAALLQAFARSFVPSVLTEPLGVTLACLGLLGLRSSAAQRRLLPLAASLFLLDAALNARPGPQFLGVAMALWGTGVHRRHWRRAGLVLAAVLISSALLTRALNGLYGTGEGSFTAYPAQTLYGLVHGSNYLQVSRDFPDLERSTSPEELARHLYAKSFERIRQHPGEFLANLFRNEWKFLSKLPRNLAWLVSARFFVMRGSEAGERSMIGADIDMKTGLPLLALAFLTGLLLLVRRASRTECLFWIAVMAGALASIPFVYGDAGFRGLAVLYPFLTLLFTMGLTGVRRPVIRSWARAEQGLLRAGFVLGFGLLAVSLVVPGLARGRGARPPGEWLDGLVPEQTMVLSTATITPVLVAQEVKNGLEGVPRVTGEEAARLLSLGQVPEADQIASMSTPFVVALAYDFVSRKAHHLIAPLAIMRQGPGFLRVEVERLPGSDSLFVVKQAEALAGSRQDQPRP